MDTRWFETFPVAEFDEDKSTLMTQLAATKWSSKIQFYRRVRDPRDIHDLKADMKSDHLIWMDEECFIMPRKLPRSVPHGSTFRKATANIVFYPGSVYIYGKTDDIVAHAISLLVCLKDDEARTVEIGTHYSRASDPAVPTTFLTRRFLFEYVGANPNRQLVLGRGCHLSDEQSVALASHPEPLDVGLECEFENGGRAFVETLSQRTSDFGTLSLQSPYISDRTHEVIFHVIKEVHNISLATTSSLYEGSVCFLPLLASAKRVEYEIRKHPSFNELDWLTVIPKAITLVVLAHSLPARFHKQFLQASRNVRELGLIYDWCHPPSKAQQAELLKTIEKNQNLYQVELGCLNILADFWVELLEVLGSHKSLRSVVFWFRSDPDLLQVERLAPFMEDHNHLDITFKCRCPWKVSMIEVEAIIEPIRLRNRAKALTRESAHDRPSIFGAALTNWAGGDASKISLLLSENTDLLCSLVDQPRSLAPRQRAKRQRDFHSLPESTKQQKHSVPEP